MSTPAQTKAALFSDGSRPFGFGLYFDLSAVEDLAVIMAQMPQSFGLA
jgi:hypothetical protein